MSGEIMNRIWEIFKKSFDESDRESVVGKTLAEGGVNSLNFIKFIVAVENEFDIEVDDKYLNFSQYNTVKDLLDMVEKWVS